MTLWRVRATVDDRPGYLSVLTASLALRSVNILAVQVHTTEAGAVDDFLVDTPDAMTEADLLSTIARGRGRDAFVARAEAQGLVDQPTRALGLAGRLMHDPDALGEVLVALLDAAEVTWRPAAGPQPGGFAAQQMTLTDPSGGSYEVHRDKPAFTPAEYARAQAMVEVAGAVLRQHAERTTLLLPDGAELLIRPAFAEDLAGVRRLHAHSTAATRRRRHPSLPSGPALPSGPDDARLRRLLQPSGGLTLLAVHHDPAEGTERIVAMANLLAEGDLGEVALVVQDDWQRRGIGTALLRRLLAHAGRTAFVALVGHTTADNGAIPGLLRRLGVAATTESDGPLISVTLPMPGRQLAGDEPAATSA